MSTTGGSYGAESKAVVPFHPQDFTAPTKSADDGLYTVTASSQFDATSNAAWRAFNNVLADNWATAGETANYWLNLSLPVAKVANTVTLMGRVNSPAEYARTWRLEASNDGVTYSTLYTSDQPLYASAGKQTFQFANETAYHHYRFFALTTNPGAPNPGLVEIKWEFATFSTRHAFFKSGLGLTQPDGNLDTSENIRRTGSVALGDLITAAVPTVAAIAADPVDANFALSEGATGATPSNRAQILFGTAPLSYYLERAVAATGSMTNLGNLSVADGAHSLRISVIVRDANFSVAKNYIISTQFNQFAVYREVTALTNSGPYAGNDFALYVRQVNNALDMGIRRSAGATAGTYRIRIEYLGAPSCVLTKLATVTADATVYAPVTFTSACPAPMTRAALLTLQTSSALIIGCRYTINDHVQGNLLAGTTVSVVAVAVNELGLECEVNTLFDNSGWLGTYDIDLTVVTSLTDNRGNVISGTTGTQVTAFDWGNTAYTNVKNDGGTLTSQPTRTAVVDTVSMNAGTVLNITNATGAINNLTLTDDSTSDLTGCTLAVIAMVLNRGATLNATNTVGATGFIRNSTISNATVTFNAFAGASNFSGCLIEGGSTVTVTGAGAFALSATTVANSSLINRAAVTGGTTINNTSVSGASIQHTGAGVLDIQLGKIEGQVSLSDAGNLSVLSGCTVANGSLISNASATVMTVTRSDLRVGATVRAIAGSGGTFTSLHDIFGAFSFATKEAASTAGTLAINDNVFTGGATLSVSTVANVTLTRNAIGATCTVTVGTGATGGTSLLRNVFSSSAVLNHTGAGALSVTDTTVAGLTSTVTLTALGALTVTNCSVLEGSTIGNSSTAVMTVVRSSVRGSSNIRATAGAGGIFNSTQDSLDNTSFITKNGGSTAGTLATLANNLSGAAQIILGGTGGGTFTRCTLTSVSNISVGALNSTLVACTNVTLSSFSFMTLNGASAVTVISTKLDAGSSITTDAASLGGATVTNSSLAGGALIRTLAGSTAGLLTVNNSQLFANGFLSKNGTGVITVTQSSISENARFNIAGGSRGMNLDRCRISGQANIDLNGVAPGVVDALSFVDVTAGAQFFIANTGTASNIAGAEFSGNGTNITINGTTAAAALNNTVVKSGADLTLQNAESPTVSGCHVSSESLLSFNGSTVARVVQGCTVQEQSLFSITNSTVAGTVQSTAVMTGGTYQHSGTAAAANNGVINAGQVFHNGGQLTSYRKSLGGALTTGAFTHSGIIHETQAARTLTAANINRCEIQGFTSLAPLI